MRNKLEACQERTLSEILLKSSKKLLNIHRIIIRGLKIKKQMWILKKGLKFEGEILKISCFNNKELSIFSGF